MDVCLDGGSGLLAVVELGDDGPEDIESRWGVSEPKLTSLQLYSRRATHLEVSLARMAVFRSVRSVAINGGMAGLAAEFQRTNRMDRRGRAERRID